MANKPENINTLSILMSLDKEARKDLENLKPITLEKLVESYIENARKSNVRMVDEHINTLLPPVGTKILVMVDDKWVACKRKEFITSNSPTVSFEDLGTKEIFIRPRTNIKWKVA